MEKKITKRHLIKVITDLNKDIYILNRRQISVLFTIAAERVTPDILGIIRFI